MGKQQESLFERLTFFVWVSKNIEIISQILLILASSSQEGEEDPLDAIITMLHRLFSMLAAGRSLKTGISGVQQKFKSSSQVIFWT